MGTFESDPASRLWRAIVDLASPVEQLLLLKQMVLLVARLATERERLDEPLHFGEKIEGKLVQCETVLQVDAGKRCRELPPVSRRDTDQGRKLTEAPMRRCDRKIASRDRERLPFAIITAGRDADRRAFDSSRPASLAPAMNRVEQTQRGTT